MVVSGNYDDIATLWANRQWGRLPGQSTGQSPRLAAQLLGMVHTIWLQVGHCSAQAVWAAARGLTSLSLGFLSVKWEVGWARHCYHLAELS